MSKRLIIVLSMLTVAAVSVAGTAHGGRAAAPLQQGGHGTSYLPHIVANHELSLRGDPPRGYFQCDTGVQVQNLDLDHSAAIALTLYPQPDGSPLTLPAPSAAPGAATLFYLPDLSQRNRGIYAGIADSDRAIGAIARTDCAGPGKAAMYSQAELATEVILPLAVKDYYSQCSLISVQNADKDAPWEATIAFYESGAPTPVATFKEAINPGTSVTMDLCRDSAYTTLPGGFVGTARVTAASPVAVQSYVDIESSYLAIYAFEGVPVDDAAAELYIPLFRSRQPYNPRDPNTQYYDTGIAVVNPNDAAVDVQVEYFGALGAPDCVGETFTQGPFEIPAGSGAVFYQGPADQPLTGRHPLPDNCVGSARITSEGGPIVAIVNDSLNFVDEAAAYNAVSAAQASTRVALPLFRAGHTSWNLYTGVSAMNVGDGPANITLEATASTGSQVRTTQSSVGVMESALFWPGDFANNGAWADPSRAYGSAMITSDQPLAVIVNDMSLAGKADAATYNGIKADVE